MIYGKKEIVEYFETLLDKYGDHNLALDWKSREGQLLRFSVLFDITAYSEKDKDFSMLDVGCGTAHMYDFLNEMELIKSRNITYSGIDISQKMIDFAKKKYPKLEFNVVDLINDKMDKQYDYVVCSGAFNINLGDLDEHKRSVKQMIHAMYDTCNVGVAVNFLSTNTYKYLVNTDDAETKRYVYLTEEEVISWVKEKCERFVLRRDYHPGDFTVYMLK